MQYWCCERKQDINCRATAILRQNNGTNVLQKKVLEHCHLPAPEKRHVLKSVHELKRKAIESSEKSIKIMRSVKRHLDEDIRLKLPSDDALREYLCRFMVLLRPKFVDKTLI